MIDDATTLAQLGELRLIDEVILPIARAHDMATEAGDDCAYIEANGVLAVTADVGPKPLLHALPGYGADLEAAGWLAVVATASDVATAGAEPLFLTNCIDAPPELTVGELRRFLDGYFQACAAFGFRNGGGDVRHGPKLAARVFGAGLCRHGRRPGRAGVQPGDRLALIGPAGEFMATYLLAQHADAGAVRQGRLFGEAEEILRRPRPQLAAMQRLVEADVIAASSDTSDGLLGALDNLCRRSGTGMRLELTRDLLSERVQAAARAHGVDPWNVFAAWGDWAVAVAVRPDRRERFAELCAQHGIPHRALGFATAPGEMTACVDGGPPRRLTVIRNENFIAQGFNAGLDGHLAYLLHTPLFAAP
jgi:thiamine-monophosphate kinase